MTKTIKGTLITLAAGMALLSTALCTGFTTASAASAESTDVCGHKYEMTEVVNPTCTEQGYTLYECSYCGDSYKDNYTSAAGHTYTTVEVAASCTHKGYTSHFCTVCGYEYTDNYIDETGHSYTEEEVAATCEEQGYTLHTCTECGYEYKDNYTDKLGHEYTAEVTDATCLEGGYTTYSCETCGDTFTDDYTDATGHNYISYITAATCVSYGYTEHICSDCGDRYVTDYVEPTGHTYLDVVIAATEDSAGYTRHICTKCNYSYISDLVLSGDTGYIEEEEEVEVHIHNYNLYTQVDTENKTLIAMRVCDCGVNKTGGLYVFFVDTEGEYTELKLVNSTADYSALYGEYLAVIIDEDGNILKTLGIIAEEEQEDDVAEYTEDPVQEHSHDYMLYVLNNATDKTLNISLVCDCGEVQTDGLTVLFKGDDGIYNQLIADENGTVSYENLYGDYTVLIMDEDGNDLKTFTLSAGEELAEVVNGTDETPDDTDLNGSTDNSDETDNEDNTSDTNETEETPTDGENTPDDAETDGTEQTQGDDTDGEEETKKNGSTATVLLVILLVFAIGGVAGYFIYKKIKSRKSK